MQHTFIAVYVGRTISTARIIAASADPALVADVVERLLGTDDKDEETQTPVTEVSHGRRRALQLMQKEKESEAVQ